MACPRDPQALTPCRVAAVSSKDEIMLSFQSPFCVRQISYSVPRLSNREEKLGVDYMCMF